MGFKFWAFVVGGAAVEPELEEFWKQRLSRRLCTVDSNRDWRRLIHRHRELRGLFRTELRKPTLGEPERERSRMNEVSLWLGFDVGKGVIITFSCEASQDGIDEARRAFKAHRPHAPDGLVDGGIGGDSVREEELIGPDANRTGDQRVEFGEISVEGP